MGWRPMVRWVPRKSVFKRSLSVMGRSSLFVARGSLVSKSGPVGCIATAEGHSEARRWVFSVGFNAPLVLAQCGDAVHEILNAHERCFGAGRENGAGGLLAESFDVFQAEA